MNIEWIKMMPANAVEAREVKERYWERYWESVKERGIGHRVRRAREVVIFLDPYLWNR